MPVSPPCAAATIPRQQNVPVVEQVKMARDTYRLRLAAPELAASVVPGQFFMIRAPELTDPLLGRPFALYDTWLDDAGRPAGIDIVYLVVGKMTALMSGWSAGDRVEIWGPLGNGFPVPDAARLLLVAGGIGNTPFPAVAREALGLRRYGRATGGEWERGIRTDGETERRREEQPLSTHHSPLTPPPITFCYGARSVEYLAGLDDFAALGVDVRVATDDGSRGHRGFVTDLVAEWLNETKMEKQRDGETERTSLQTPLTTHDSPLTRASIYCCGPEPMMHAVARLAAQHGVRCWLSLETPMACGFGACFSCVTRVKQPGGGWDYRRTCVEGPIFPAEALEF